MKRRGFNFIKRTEEIPIRVTVENRRYRTRVVSRPQWENAKQAQKISGKHLVGNQAGRSLARQRI
jgi:hypothetical protein